MEISDLLDKEYKKKMIIKMLNTLGRRMDEHRNNFSKELEHIKKNQTEVKNTINEKKMYTRRNQE